jgi:hypothetical protein
MKPVLTLLSTYDGVNHASPISCCSAYFVFAALSAYSSAEPFLESAQLFDLCPVRL